MTSRYTRLTHPTESDEYAVQADVLTEEHILFLAYMMVCKTNACLFKTHVLQK